jgi:hypothetical protein
MGGDSSVYELVQGWVNAKFLASGTGAHTDDEGEGTMWREKVQADWKAGVKDS